MASDWTELYRPTNLDEVQGNPKAVKELREWGKSWETGRPDKKAAVLMGPPGIGKTSAALALAGEFSWGVIEMNASDERNADAIQKIALRGALADTFTDEGRFLSSRRGERKLIILDEADNIFGREDRGGIPAISDLIKRTQQPVVLIVNDFYELSRRSSIVKSSSKQIRFNKIRTPTIVRVLGGIVQSEGLKVSERALEMIAENADGDMRAAIRDLQSLAMGRKEIREKDALILQNRFASPSTRNLMAEIFKGSDPLKARTLAWDVEESPDHIMLWVEENLPYEYRTPSDLVRGFEILARADLFMGRVRRRQYFGFWGYASDLMTFGVAAAKEKGHRGYSGFRFPGYLMKMSRTKRHRGVQSSISRKIGKLCHTSEYRAKEELLPYFTSLFQKNRDFRVSFSIDLGLEPEEMAFLLREKEDSHAIKHLLSDVEQVKHVRRMDEPPLVLEELEEMEEQEELEEPSEPRDLAQQKSLFEY
jgi:replication factor C large subunit